MKQNSTHPASLILMRDALAREGRHILETTLGEVETTAEGEGLCAVEFRPKGLEPVTVAGLSAEQTDALGWMFAAADTARRRKPRWDFTYDEEDGNNGTFRGVLTDGSRFLFWKTWHDASTGADMCAIYNSIRMTDDTEEVRYEWDSDNDALVTACLDALEDKDSYCGDESPLRDIEFITTRTLNKEMGDRAAEGLKKRPEVIDASFNGEDDTLKVTVRKGTLGRLFDRAGVLSAFVHLCPDYGYYTVQYETSNGPLTIGGMFAGNDGVAEEVSGYPFIHEEEPDWLLPLLEACEKSGRDPSWLDVREESENGNKTTDSNTTTPCRNSNTRTGSTPSSPPTPKATWTRHAPSSPN